MTDQDDLIILGHTIGLNAEGVWSCSCGFTGTPKEMGDHLAQDIASQVEGKLNEAMDSGLVPGICMHLGGFEKVPSLKWAESLERCPVCGTVREVSS